MLEQIAIENIETDIEELEKRVKAARFELKRYKGNVKMTQIIAENVLYSSKNLSNDVGQLISIRYGETQ